MSRIGKQPIPIPKGVTVEEKDGQLVVVGTKGIISIPIHYNIQITVAENFITVAPRHTTKQSRALWGLFRALIANMVTGVTDGFKKKLEIEGVGYRVNMEASGLLLQLGFSHPVRFPAPEGVIFALERNAIIVSGIRKDVVNQTAARIRALKPPEPYKGKGIRYEGEVVRRKAGKKASAGG